MVANAVCFGLVNLLYAARFVFAMICGGVVGGLIWGTCGGVRAQRKERERGARARRNQHEEDDAMRRPLMHNH